MVQTKPYDAAEFLDSEEVIAEYLHAVFEEGDPAIIAQAIGDVMKAKGMSEISNETGLSRTALYRSFSVNGNPSLETLAKAMKSIGFRLDAVPAH